jgi:3-oxoacyl-[acyl-carrier protein] reductase
MTHTALVTGGSSGIGAEICRTLLDGGYEVVSLDRNPPSLRHDRFRSIQVDLADAVATRNVAADVASRFRVSHFVHCAGIIRPALLPDVQPEDMGELAQLHLAAPLLLVQPMLPAMQAAGFGRIVLISSRAALGVPTRSAYSATKAGLIGLARTWALELAAFGITVNVVAPGPIASTAMFHSVVPSGSEQEARLASSIPVRRLGRPDDVARAVLFFADPANSYVTGQTLFVCGGSSVGSITI